MLPGFLHHPPIAHTLYLMPVIPDSEREIGRFDPLPPSCIYINTGICKSKSICHIFLSYFFTWHTFRSNNINITILCTWNLHPLQLWSTKLTSHPFHDLTNVQCAQNHSIALNIKHATFAHTLEKNHIIVAFQDVRNVSHVLMNWLVIFVFILHPIEEEHNVVLPNIVLLPLPISHDNAIIKRLNNIQAWLPAIPAAGVAQQLHHHLPCRFILIRRQRWSTHLVAHLPL